MTHSNLLQGLPNGIAVNRLLPLDTVLQIIVPQIQLNDPARAHALPEFAAWLKDREVDVTLDQAAWLWTNYTTQFVREIPKRVSQWMHTIGKGERKNPLALAREFSKAWTFMVLEPLINSLKKSLAGRWFVKALSLAGKALLFLVVVLLATALIQYLQEARQPVHMLFMLLGFA